MKKHVCMKYSTRLKWVKELGLPFLRLFATAQRMLWRPQDSPMIFKCCKKMWKKDLTQLFFQKKLQRVWGQMRKTCIYFNQEVPSLKTVKLRPENVIELSPFYKNEIEIVISLLKNEIHLCRVDWNERETFICTAVFKIWLNRLT